MATNASSRFYDWLSGMTQALGYTRDADLARALDVDQSIVSRWRKGTSRPGVQHLVRVSKLTGTPIEPLLVIAGHVSPDDVRHAEMPEPPVTADPGERMIQNTVYDDETKAVLSQFWKRRVDEEHRRLEKIVAMLAAWRNGKLSESDRITPYLLDLLKSDLRDDLMRFFEEIVELSEE